MNDLERVLDAVNDRKQQVDSLDTQLSLLIEQVETAIRTHVNIRISVDLSERETLVFGKHGGQWHLMIANDIGETPLASCPRERRAEVFAGKWVNQLLNNAVHQIADDIAQRELAIKEATDLLHTLKVAS